MSKNLFFSLIACLSFAACGEEENEDVVQKPDHQGAIETIVNVSHAAGYDLLTTTHKVWVKGNLDKTIVRVDTLKALETTKQAVEDSTGNTHAADVQKDYEFYITVK